MNDELRVDFMQRCLDIAAEQTKLLQSISDSLKIVIALLAFIGGLLFNLVLHA